MEKYINKKGEVGVLVSNGYGVGWSTWHSTDNEFLCMDKTLVEIALRKASEDEVEKYCVSKDIEPYMGGWKDVEVEWLAVGTNFMIDEYDGSETLRLISDLSMKA